MRRLLVALAFLALCVPALAGPTPVTSQPLAMPLMYTETARHDSNCYLDSSVSCYYMATTQSNYAYLGHDSPGTKQAYHADFRWRVGSEGSTSGLVVSFALDDGSPSSATKGVNSGVSANSVQFRFKESGSDTHIVARMVKNGVNTDFWSSTQDDNPEQWQKWRVEVDARNGVVRIRDLDTDTSVVEKEFSGLAGPIHSVWFIARGYSSVSNGQALQFDSSWPKFADTDALPPVLGDPAQLTNDIQPDASVEVRVTASDDWGLETVELHYTVNSAPQPPLPMQLSDSHYSASIPGQDAGDRVEYWVFARDTTHLETTSSSWEYVVGEPASRQKTGDGSQFSPQSGSITQAGLSPMVLVAALLIAVGAFVVGRIVSQRSGNPQHAIYLTAFGVVGALGYGFYMANIADIQERLADIPGAFYGAVAALLVVAIVFRVRSARRPM